MALPARQTDSHRGETALLAHQTDSHRDEVLPPSMQAGSTARSGLPMVPGGCHWPGQHGLRGGQTSHSALAEWKGQESNAAEVIGRLCSAGTVSPNFHWYLDS